MSVAGHYHEEEALGKAYDARLMKRLLSYVRPYKWLVVVAVALLLVNSVAQISLTILTQIAIDDYIKVGNQLGLFHLSMGFLGVVFLVLGTTYAQMYLTLWLGQRVLDDIRMEVFEHLQKLHLQFFDKNPVGRLLTRATNDVNVLNEMFSSGVVSVAGDIFMLILIVGALLYYNWQLALITFLVLPLLVIVTFMFRARARDAYRTVRLKLARLNAFTQEHLTGVNVVQLFTQEKRTYGRYDKINRELQGGYFKSIYYYAVFFPVVEIIGALSVGLLLYYGGVRVEAGVLTYGELVAFIHLVERFYRPIRDLSEKYNILQSSMASSERIFNLLDTRPVMVTPRIAQRPSEFKGRIELENVWFAYNDEDWVLKDVSFTVESGEKVAFVGATGAGKTSLTSLLFRFYDYQKGSIKIDGVEIKDMDVDELRAQLGLVLQDVYLFSGDIAGNVRLRDEEITDDQVREALRRVGYDRFINVDGDDIHGTVRERGATFSTGQKQLLSFARALAFDPNILILDEATSSVDTETELLIQEALEELLRGRTSLIVAHRLSTIEKADKIIVLHHGEIREMGRHRELLAQGGIYSRLYEMQYKSQERGTELATPAAMGRK